MSPYLQSVEVQGVLTCLVFTAASTNSISKEKWIMSPRFNRTCPQVLPAPSYDLHKMPRRKPASKVHACTQATTQTSTSFLCEPQLSAV